MRRPAVGRSPHQEEEIAMTDQPAPAPLLAAVERYFALMYDNDVSRFDQVFAPSAQLHGLRDGELRLIPAADYRNNLAARPSPQSKNAPRLQEVLLVDFASPTQAIVKVRVRIDTQQYLDYLSWHLIGGAWRITAKSFHVERVYETAA
jgi:Putative lumazine-binding